MPCGSVRKDLNKTGVSYRKGNPVPPEEPDYNSNPVPPDEVSDNSNPIPAEDPTFNSNPVTWQPSSSHFGNNIS